MKSIHMVLRLSSAILTAATVLGIVLAGCFSSELTEPHRLSEDPVEIVDGYFLGEEEGYGYIVATRMTSDESGEGIYAVQVSNAGLVGWNDEFIVVETSADANTSKGWYVIVVSTGQVYHCAEDFQALNERSSSEEMCTSFKEFLDLKVRLSVPANLAMRDPSEVYEQLKRP